MRTTHTQRAAHDALDASTRHTQKQMILDLFHGAHMKLTRQQIADCTNLSRATVCGCVRELLDDAKLVVCGELKCAATDVLDETLGLPCNG